MDVIDGLEVGKLAIGGMRFRSAIDCDEIIHICMQHGVKYIDTSPSYCYLSDKENCEVWVGKAIHKRRGEFIVSAKSSPGNGGNGYGEFDSSYGLNVRSEKDVRKMIEQSLRRLDIECIDCYQMWAINNIEIFNEALKADGWLNGVLKAKEEGLIKHIGATGHADYGVWNKIIDTGYFEMITIPFNILSAERLPCIEYAQSKGILVFAMNPLAGGLLSENGSSEFWTKLKSRSSIKSIKELAFQYCYGHNVVPLSGMRTGREAAENCMIYEKISCTKEDAEKKYELMNSMIKYESTNCTSCGYCRQCPCGIDIPGILKIYNYYNLFKIQEVKNRLLELMIWKTRYNIFRCISCRKCEKHCPNSVPIMEIFREIRQWSKDI